ncbi:MAG: hypothetical protein ACFB0E_11505 [Leptolyngbyaceae cyanobacterium]
MEYGSDGAESVAAIERIGGVAESRDDSNVSGRERDAHTPFSIVESGCASILLAI